ncbi:hypothetical protein [Anaerovorax odorimutans]|uniref:hypothetical protein n=1 Tax=Anaerovorax odorimutans TaxID=109327 RepID=UPI000422A037|nr:hypothetical protein [Anaerovorax odorimutans]
MSKIINFRTVCYPYDKVIEKIVEPIARYLPYSTQNYEYLEGGLNVSFFQEIHPHNDVFMSHGIADKNWRNADIVKDYDYICVSGPLWQEKMIKQGIPSSKLLLTGYTKIDPLFKLKKDQKINDKKINVLFAPTNSVAARVITYEKLLKTIKEVSKDINIIYAYHPGNDKSSITYEQYLIADVVISDISSTLYEAWALDIPVVFPDWVIKDEVVNNYTDSFEDFIFKNNIGYHASSCEEMIKMIYEAKEKGLDNKTKEFIEGIFPTELRGSSGKITAEILQQIADN